MIEGSRRTDPEGTEVGYLNLEGGNNKLKSILPYLTKYAIMYVQVNKLSINESRLHALHEETHLVCRGLILFISNLFFEP